MGDEYRRLTNRALSAEELTLLRWLVEHGTEEAAQYADQIKRVRVISQCTCGCPTIELALDDQPGSTGGSLIISDYVGATREGVDVGVILHVRGEALSELEIYSLNGEDPTSLPRAEDLKAWEDAAV